MQPYKLFLAKSERSISKELAQTILFGSKARGDSTPASDIDILVILRNEEGPIRNQILTTAARISLDYDVLLNPIIVSEGRYQRQQGFTFYQNAVRDAISLTLKHGRLTVAPGMHLPGG